MFFTTLRRLVIFTVFFFTAPATTEIYTLSLHDALPISRSKTLGRSRRNWFQPMCGSLAVLGSGWTLPPDRKSTRLNSSHVAISYAVFCLKKKKKKITHKNFSYTNFAYAPSNPCFLDIRH